MKPILACAICGDHGIIAVGNGVQYCVCPLGRQKKQEWLAFPEEDRLECEVGPRLVPQSRHRPNTRYEVEAPIHTLPDDGDLFGPPIRVRSNADHRVMSASDRTQYCLARCEALLQTDHLNEQQRKALSEYAEVIGREVNNNLDPSGTAGEK